MAEKKFENTTTSVMTDHYFKHCYVTITALIYQAKLTIAKETRKFGLSALKAWFSKDLTFDFNGMFL